MYFDLGDGRILNAAVAIWNWFWGVWAKASGIKCWFVGHNEILGLGHEPNYCNRCFIDDPRDTTTLPDLLQRGYGWLVERDWAWFDRLDDWLCENHGKRLPHWWAY